MSCRFAYILALLLTPTAAFGQATPLPGSNVMISPVGGGSLAPRALVSQDLYQGSSCPSGQVFNNSAGTIQCQTVVTSVGQTFTGGIVAVAGQPVIGAGTIALTVAGTSGGIPYFNGANTWTSSSALSLGQLVQGGGPGTAPSTFALTGDCTLTSPTITCTKTNGVALGTFATNNYATPPAIGGTTPNTGAFTTLSSSSTVSGVGFSTYLASPPAIGGTAAAPAKFSQLTAATWFQSTASPSLSVALVGNGITNISTASVTAASASTTTSENLFNIGFSMNTASAGAYNNTVDPKVALYAGGTCSSGAKACWTENTLMTLNSPLNANFFSALATENDFNNASGNNFHNAYGALGTQSSFVGNILITGSSTNQVDYAIVIGGLNNSTNHGMYNRGIVILKDPLGSRLSDFQTESSASAVLSDFGTHQYGLDMNATTYSGAALNVHPSGSSAIALNIAGTFTTGALTDSSTSPYGLFMNGTYSVTPLYANGIIQTTSFIANGTVATVLGSLGPVGSHTTVQEWFEVKDTGGTIRYVPGF